MKKTDKIEMLRNLRVNPPENEREFFIDVVYSGMQEATHKQLDAWLSRAKNNDPDYPLIYDFVVHNYDFTSKILEEGKILDKFWHKNQYPGKSFIEYSGIKFIAFYGGDDYYSIISDEF